MAFGCGSVTPRAKTLQFLFLFLFFFSDTTVEHGGWFGHPQRPKPLIFFFFFLFYHKVLQPPQISQEWLSHPLGQNSGGQRVAQLSLLFFLFVFQFFN
jgi:hypothetical protein